MRAKDVDYLGHREEKGRDQRERKNAFPVDQEINGNCGDYHLQGSRGTV